MQRKTITVLVTVLLLAATASVAPVSAQQAEGYAGTNVTFQTESNAIVDYAVDGETMVESLQTQSQSQVQSGTSVTADVALSTVTNIGGSSVSVGSTTQTQASVTTESGATMTAHDNAHGILVVRSGGESQYVTANLSDSAQAESEGNGRVVVTNENGTQGTFLVVGDGEVTVNEEGNVSAHLGENSTLVFRSYPDERSDDDSEQERLIAEGTAAAEVYVMQTGENGSESGSEFAADVVQYSEDTTIEVSEQSEGAIRMTANRTQEQGTVIITSLSEQAASSAEDIQVTVDGEAAVEASSYSQLESATNGGDSSRFLVRQGSSAEANTDVLVGVNHFSTREIAVTDTGGNSTDNGTETDSTENTTNDGDNETDGSDDSTETTTPGLGITAGVLALLSVALLARVRS